MQPFKKNNEGRPIAAFQIVGGVGVLCFIADLAIPGTGIVVFVGSNLGHLRAWLVGKQLAEAEADFDGLGIS